MIWKNRQIRKYRDDLYSYYAPSSGFLGRIMLFACMCDYVKDVDGLTWPGDFPKQQVVKDASFLCSRDYPSYIKASYIYAVGGNIELGDIFSLSIISDKYGSASEQVHNEYHTFLLNMIAFIEQSVSGFINVAQIGPRKLPSVVAALCVRDKFWYQAQKYEDDIKARGKFLYHNEWKNIPPIMYQIQQRRNGNIIIYRMMQ